MLATFRGGIGLPCTKALTAKAQIVTLEPPKILVFPMRQHIGEECHPVVAVGQQVFVGQKLGEGNTNFSAPIHSSVSGKVVAIEIRAQLDTSAVESVVIANDYLNSVAPWLAIKRSYKDLQPNEIINIIKEAGVVGMGGAGFPAHLKLSSLLNLLSAKQANKAIKYLIINGSESDPYVASDCRLMLENSSDILMGIQIILWCLRLRRAYIGIESNDSSAADKMSQSAKLQKGVDIRVVKLKRKYPQGAEKQLIETITGQQVPPGKRPTDIGILTFNIGTVLAISRAVTENIPLIERIVTVSGDCVATPSNFRVKLGTSIEHLFNSAGGFKKKPTKVLIGGSMMGHAVLDLTTAIVKTTSSVLAIRDEMQTSQKNTCIRCGRCISHCPMQLMPIYLMLNVERNNTHNLKKYNISDCIECGCCSYICPAKLHITQTIRFGKKAINVSSSSTPSRVLLRSNKGKQ